MCSEKVIRLLQMCKLFSLTFESRLKHRHLFFDFKYSPIEFLKGSKLLVEKFHVELEFIDLLFDLSCACLHYIIAIFHADDSLVHGYEQFIDNISDFIFKPKPLNLIGFGKGLKFCR